MDSCLTPWKGRASSYYWVSVRSVFELSLQVSFLVLARVDKHIICNIVETRKAVENGNTQDKEGISYALDVAYIMLRGSEVRRKVLWTVKFGDN